MIKVKLTKWLGIYFFPPFTRFAFCMCKMWRCWRVLWLDAYEFSSCFWFEWETAFLQSTKLLIGTFFNRSFIQFCEAFCLSFIHTCSSTHTHRDSFFTVLQFCRLWQIEQIDKRQNATHTKKTKKIWQTFLTNVSRTGRQVYEYIHVFVLCEPHGLKRLLSAKVTHKK